MRKENEIYGCENCGSKCSAYQKGRKCDKWTPQYKMRKQVWIHCKNNCFESVKISEEITAPHPYLSHWICTECGSACTLELVDLEKPKKFGECLCDKCIGRDDCRDASEGVQECNEYGLNPMFAEKPKPSPAPPLRDAKETETRGAQSERRKRESEKREEVGHNDANGPIRTEESEDKPGKIPNGGCISCEECTYRDQDDLEICLLLKAKKMCPKTFCINREFAATITDLPPEEQGEFKRIILDMHRSVGNHDHEKQEVPEEKTWPELVEMCRVLQKGFEEIINGVSYIAKPEPVKQEPTGILRTVSKPLCETCAINCKERDRFNCDGYKVMSDQALCETCTRTCKFAKVCQGFTVNPSVDEVKQEVRLCSVCTKNLKCTLSQFRGDCRHFDPVPEPKPESEDTVMDFQNALTALKMGSKVRRVGWFHGVHLFLAHEKIWHRGKIGAATMPWTPYDMTSELLLAEDWMLYFD